MTNISRTMDGISTYWGSAVSTFCPLAIIEPIFSLPGIGAELINAININDLPLVEGIVVVFALVTVAGNLLADLLYTVLDPRIRYGRAAS